MQSHNFDIVILGGGCIGSSILHELCQRGVENVALVDYGRSMLSATAHSGGMLRVFHENIEHINLALQNLHHIQTYRQLGVITENINANGCLYFFNKSRYQGYKHNLLRMSQANYAFDVLTPQSGEKLFPQYRWGKSWAIYEPMAGQLTPQSFMQDLHKKSKELGAHIMEDIEISRICPYRDYYRISGEQFTITSKMLILAGGSRMLPRLHDLGVTLPFTTKTIMTYIAQKEKDVIQLPNYFDRESLRFACFSHDKRIILSDEHCTRVLRKTWGEISEKKAVKDMYSYNRMGFLGRVPGYADLFLATGWGGTAFKFALEVGHRVADIVGHG